MPRRSRLPAPFTTLSTPRATFTFYQGDCLEIVPALDAGSVDAVVTSPPYNLGVRYRTYEDALPREEYLRWTRQWVRTVARSLNPEGSLFLNVGAKPTDPWAAMDVAQAARRYLTLQNTLHWIKSIAIDREAVGGATGLKRDLAVGHYKPINSSAS